MGINSAKQQKNPSNVSVHTCSQSNRNPLENSENIQKWFLLFSVDIFKHYSVKLWIWLYPDIVLIDMLFVLHNISHNIQLCENRCPLCLDTLQLSSDKRFSKPFVELRQCLDYLKNFVTLQKQMKTYSAEPYHGQYVYISDIRLNRGSKRCVFELEYIICIIINFVELI